MSVKVTLVAFVLFLCAATLFAAVPMRLPAGIERLPNGNTLICDAGTMGQPTARVIEVDSNEHLVWAYVRADIQWAHTARRLPGGNTIISATDSSRVIEINPSGNVEWEMTEGLSMPNDVFRLPNGNTLITDRGDNFVKEIDSGRNVVWSYTNLSGPHNGNRLANGNTLICDSDRNKVIEVDPTGQTVWQYATGLSWGRCAQRLANGNTLITDSRHNRVIEIDSAGSNQWTFSGGLSMPYMATRLATGNTIISTDTRVLEVSQAGSIVWQYPPSSASVTVETLWVTNPTSGCSMYVHIHRPANAGPTSRVPAVVLVPDLSKPGTVFDDSLLAANIASDGFAVLHFDADGRGRSRHGAEDYGGAVQQDGLRACALLFASEPYVDTEKLGIYARGYGIVMATGMIARSESPRFKFLLDFEGPSDRYQCCTDSGGHVPVSPDSEAFWQEREAGRFIKQVPGAYLRIQTDADHTGRMPNNKHAVALIDSATSTEYGGAGISVWTRVNDSVMNPDNTTYTLADPPQWIAEKEERNLVCRELLYLHELASRDFASAVTNYPPPPTRIPGLALDLSPNPCREQVTVRFASSPASPASLNLYDASGRSVRAVRLTTADSQSELTMNIGDLAPGIYFMRLGVGVGAASGKLVVR